MNVKKKKKMKPSRLILTHEFIRLEIRKKRDGQMRMGGKIKDFEVE